MGPRTFHHSAFGADRVGAQRDATISVCVPAREEASTIAAVLEPLVGLRERGIVDQLVVIDAGSSDGTPDIARRLGAEVHDERTLLPGFGPVEGKGDAMWRALSVLSGDVVCFLDADTEGFDERFAWLVGPLVCERGFEFVKACYRRPLKLADVALPEGGGRVNELTARPLLKAFYPELAGFRQPLAGEFAARRTLLGRLPFATGYAVEIALLIDAYKDVGLDAMAQVDLDVRQNRHQPLSELAPMAEAVLGAVIARLGREGRLDDDGFSVPLERPPLASLAAPA